MIFILAFGYLFSRDRKLISWRVVLSGLVLQGLIAYLALKTEWGGAGFEALSAAVVGLVDLSARGGKFAFGPLYSDLGFVFALKVPVAIIFICTLTAILFQLRVIQPVLRLLAKALQRLMGLSGAEILAAIGSALVGQIESALPLRPYFHKLTDAQFFSIMAGGMATMAASVLAVYISLGLPGKYLLAANFMGIPAGLLMAHLLWPSELETRGQSLPEEEQSKFANVIEAAMHGASEGVKISVAVVGMIIAFISIFGLVDQLLRLAGLSLTGVLGWVLWPVAWLIGVSGEESAYVASLIGTKLSFDEFVAYLRLIEMHAVCPLSPRGYVLAIFAVCGFANFGSVAMQVASFSHMLPERKSTFAAMGLRAMLAGALASLLSACWVSFFQG